MFSWLTFVRRHVVNDLDAYVCLFEECGSPEELYSHSSQWLKHMREHALRWRCASKSHGEFLGISREEYIEHMKTAHRSRLTDAQLRILADKSARTIGQIFKSCPLCGIEETHGSMEEHVVGHLRLLALKSLPVCEDGGFGNPDNASTDGSAPPSRSTVQDFMNTHPRADDTSWGTPPAASSTSPGRPRLNNGSGSNASTTSASSAIKFQATDDLPVDNRGTRRKPIIRIDPCCSICSLPAEKQCNCESEAVETALRQAETKMMPSLYNEINIWVRSHAQDIVLKRFNAATAAYSDSRAHKDVDEVLGDVGDVSDPAAAALKGKINELWSEALLTFPETLDYFYSLLELNLPSDDDPAVRNPPLDALTALSKSQKAAHRSESRRESQNRHPQRITPEASSGHTPMLAAEEGVTIREG